MARTCTSSPARPAARSGGATCANPTRVRLRLQGRDLEGIATASSDPEAVAAGLRHYLARYPKAARPLGVRVDANGTPHGTTTAAHPLVVVRVHLDRRQH
jgi:hypothetical protein